MRYGNLCSCLLVTGVWLAAPVLVSAKGLPYSAESWSTQNSFIFKVQTERWELDRPPLGGKGVYSYGSELFRAPELFRDSKDRSSDTDMRSYSDSLGPSLDMPGSVNGNSRMVNPWWERRSSADPMVQDLSRMDGGGFSSSGSGGGSVPGYHGR